MSDSDGDFSDELLELAGAGEKRRKKSASKKAKRRKADAPTQSTSDGDFESEEDDSVPAYPLEGKFVDEADRQKLMQLPEIEREAILAQRLEELQRIQDKRNLDQMLRAQRGEPDGVAKAAKRAHTARGSTKEKSRKLDELKAKRKAKSENKRTKANSPKRDRSSSPMDMEMSSEDEEDGQISRQEEQEEREARLLNQHKPRQEDEIPTLREFDFIRLSRSDLLKCVGLPWFEEYAKGAFVRYLVGNDKHRGPTYKLFEITNVFEAEKAYTVDEKTVKVQLELTAGKTTKKYLLDRVSNSTFTEEDFDEYMATLQRDQVKPPKKSAMYIKISTNQRLGKQQLTETDVNAMLALKAAKVGKTAAKASLERSRLQQQKTLAEKRHDYKEVEELDIQIKALETEFAGVEAPSVSSDDMHDLLAKVNERNRRANMEAVRKAEAEFAERKRRERRLALAASSSRPGTPGLKPGTPLGTPNMRSVSPMPNFTLPQKDPNDKRTFESIVASAVEVDLGDF